jgi:hypothetical protein
VGEQLFGGEELFIQLSKSIVERDKDITFSNTSHDPSNGKTIRVRLSIQIMKKNKK